MTQEQIPDVMHLLFDRGQFCGAFTTPEAAERTKAGRTFYGPHEIVIFRSERFIAEMLALLKEAHRDAVNDRDSFYEAATNADGVYSDPEDAVIVAELDDFIARLDAAITKVEAA